MGIIAVLSHAQADLALFDVSSSEHFDNRVVDVS